MLSKLSQQTKFHTTSNDIKQYTLRAEDFLIHMDADNIKILPVLLLRRKCRHQPVPTTGFTMCVHVHPAHLVSELRLCNRDRLGDES